jgi:glycosyltransferase involved in cell wall biosynthesis
MLMAGAVETRIIPYGVDLSIFKPADQSAARRALNLPLDAHILLFSAASIRQNPFKDYLTMRQAVERVAASMDNQQVIFLALGEDAPSEHLSATTQIRFIPYQADLRQIALFYQASDLYIHAAKADTFPNAVLEALACGVPVVGSTVGGIPEQIYPFDESPRPTGILAQSGDSGAMAQGIVHLLHHPDLRRQMGESAAQDAQRRYDLNRQIGDYLEWYRTILADFYNIIPKQKIPNA